LKYVLFALLTIIIVIILLIGGALYLQVIFLTTPARDPNITTPAGLPYTDVTLTTADGLNISGWYIPGARSEAIVLVHGIHANRAYLLPQARILAEAGYPLLLIDLRGHGKSEEALMTYGYNEALDVQVAVAYLLALPEIDQVAVLGHSLGAAAVVRAAAMDDRLKAIVIQSSYSSLSQAVEDSFENFSLFPRRPFAPMIIALAEFRTGVKLSQVNSSRDLAAMRPRPVLVIHSADDNLFPLHHAQQMYEAANEPKDIWIVSGLPHINPITGYEAEYKDKIVAFFDAAFAH
jgi:dipeptidyl aminopeptidase/acylaminoacyl peptidase